MALGCLFLLLVLSGFSCRAPMDEVSVQINGFAMATSYSVTAIGPVPGSVFARKLHAQVAAVIARIESKTSIFEPQSDISRFNASSSTDWFPVSTEAVEVVGISMEMSQVTDGAFDITVGRAVEKWGFGPHNVAAPTRSLNPTPQSVSHIDYRKLVVRSLPPALRKSDPHIRIDLSGIAKGYAVDRVAETLEAENIHRYIVEIGGELRTAGMKADRSLWKIGVAAPAGSRLDMILHVTDIAVATSGDYRNVYLSNGRRLSHIINPGTGTPISNSVASVTVVDKECARADALATALAVLGSDKGHNLGVRKGWATYFILRGNSGWTFKATPAFAALLN